MSSKNGYTMDSDHILSSGHDLKKLAEAMGWRKMDGLIACTFVYKLENLK